MSQKKKLEFSLEKRAAPTRKRNHDVLPWPKSDDPNSPGDTVRTESKNAKDSAENSTARESNATKAETT